MPNRLKDETSPYLLQHADNPVDWHPWDAEALALARDTGKPILLSIGYSACHWCHVMAHESFEHEPTARLMNELFVNIKVDREERPDIDRIYQTAQQIFTNKAGGWPLTVFLTPDSHLPIFAGTYFPREAKYGMPAFVDLLRRVESYYRSRPDEVATNGQWVLDMLRKSDSVESDDMPLSPAPIHDARKRIGEAHDNAAGGFGDSPKFPQPSFVDFLLERWSQSRRAREEDSGARAMVRRSLDAMATRGLYDHLGGGFFRYCVDRYWTIPHFEKMLYDNAALLSTFADAYAVTGDALYRRIADETADWVVREMRSPDGGFYSTLDADSEAGEGAYYVFEPEELQAVLGDDAGFAARIFGFGETPNFEGHAWHLLYPSRTTLDSMTAEESSTLESVKSRLLAHRAERTAPRRDEKILTSWNGLMIGALARAARLLSRPELAECARDSVAFIERNLWQAGRLKASWKDGKARFEGYLDDYAFVLAGLLELLQTDFRAGELELARGLADAAIAHFSDSDGGFLFTADDHESLIHRPKPLADQAQPSGNAVLALALDTLGHLVAEPRYLDAAAATVRFAMPTISRFPHAHATMLRALARQLEPVELVVVRGRDDELKQWRQAIGPQTEPGRLLFFIPANGPIDGLERYSAGAAAQAYMCRGTECSAPLASADELQRALS